jgi:hypothetical protein
LSVVNYPFVVIYSIDITAGEVQVLNVRDTARKNRRRMIRAPADVLCRW